MNKVLFIAIVTHVVLLASMFVQNIREFAVQTVGMEVAGISAAVLALSLATLLWVASEIESKKYVAEVRSIRRR